MPLTKTMQDPFSTETLALPYIRCVVLHLDFFNQTGYMDFTIHRTLEAWTAGKDQIGSFKVIITRTGTPAVYTEPPIISPYVPAVSPVFGPNNEILVAGSDAIPAVYGEAQLLIPAFPSFGQIITDNIATYNLLANVINSLAKIQDPTLSDYPEG